MRTKFVLVGVLFGLASPLLCATRITGANGLTAAIDPSGSYDVLVPDLGWHFGGNIGSPLSNMATASGADANGSFVEMGFDFQSDAPRHAAIRVYATHAAVLFTVESRSAAPNTFAFPSWTQYPRDLNHLTFSGAFAPPTFTDLAGDSPWIFFDSSANAFILSPAANFMVAATAWGPNGEMASGIAPQIAALPQGFRHQTLLVVERGINRAFDTWGEILTTLHGKKRPANDADASLNRLGYWTDNGASYYYHTADPFSYQQTLQAVHSNFESAAVGLGSLQLDSWFYPKGPNASWTDNEHGIYSYTAAPALFTSGLSAFQQSLGLPLITHGRWIDASSPYRQLYKMSGNVVTDPVFWNSVASYLAASGVATYEQDWLAGGAHTDFNLTDPDAFLDNMSAAMAQHNITLQYCMATARHFLQAAKYSNVTSIRTSPDRFDRDRWVQFLYTSRLASALGVWPFTDNFRSTELQNLLLATLSAGPVGVGDALGSLNTLNLLQAVRRDGVIVKPDVPLAPVDSSYLAMAQSAGAPQIAATWSDFGALRTYYVVAFAQAAAQTSFRPADLGLERPAYFYNYFTGAGRVIHPADVLTVPVANNAGYTIAAPVGPSGMAILGDVRQFASMGKKRIPSYLDNGTVHLTVAFAEGESSRTITGYAPFHVSARSVTGTVASVTYDAPSGQFQIVVTPGPGGSASIQIRRARPHARVEPHPGKPLEN